jgi:hypothetical protein
MPWSRLADRDGYLRATEVDTQNKSQIADLLPHHLESTTMNELPKLIRQHYENHEAGTSLVSKVTTILDSLPDGSVDSLQLAGLDQFHVMGLEATEQLAQIAGIERGATILDADETSSVLVTAGLTITAWSDVTIEALKWIGQQRPPTQGFSLGVVMGSRLGEMSANLARNIREGRVRFVMGVCTADGPQS